MINHQNIYRNFRCFVVGCSLIAFIALASSGCVRKPLEIGALTASSDHTSLDVKFVEVIDKTSAAHFDPLAVGYSSEYHPIDEKLTAPPVRAVLATRLRKSLSGSPEGKSERMTINLLDMKVLLESRVMDSVVYVGIISALAPRGLRCTAEVEFRLDYIIQRQSYRHDQVIKLSFVDLSLNERRQALDKCLEDLVQQISAFANRLAITKKLIPM